MTILLKPELRKFVADKVKAGQYTDANDLLNEAVEVLRDQERFTPKHEAYLRRELQHGLKQADRGQYSDFNAETIIAEGRAKLAAAKKTRAGRRQQRKRRGE
jgi:putative addiction module CopG family antidote